MFPRMPNLPSGKSRQSAPHCVCSTLGYRLGAMASCRTGSAGAARACYHRLRVFSRAGSREGGRGELCVLKKRAYYMIASASARTHKRTHPIPERSSFAAAGCQVCCGRGGFLLSTPKNNLGESGSCLCMLWLRVWGGVCVFAHKCMYECVCLHDFICMRRQTHFTYRSLSPPDT